MRSRLLSDVIWCTFADFSFAKKTSKYMSSLFRKSLSDQGPRARRGISSPWSKSSCCYRFSRSWCLGTSCAGPASVVWNFTKACVKFTTNLIMNVSPKSIVVSAMESKEEMKRFIDTFSGAMSSNGRILLSILPAISSFRIFLGKLLIGALRPYLIIFFQ